MGGAHWLTAAPDKYGGSLAAVGQRTGADSTAQVSVAPVVTPKMGGFGEPTSPVFAFAAVAAVAVALMAYSSAYLD